MTERDFLGEILARKSDENARRSRYRAVLARAIAEIPLVDRGPAACAALRRGSDKAPKFICEVKFASPSAGVIRPRSAGDAVRIARAYEGAGAAAISVLADGPGFAGSVLDVRRVAAAVSVPVLFKEFVTEEQQIELARCSGASMVLLLVRALPVGVLRAYVQAARAHGLAPVVEAANESELDAALESGATIVGMNARDLKTFRIDSDMAERSMARIPDVNIALFMSGIRDRDDVARVARTRADAVLVGEGLMRAADPGAKLTELREQA